MVVAGKRAIRACATATNAIVVCTMTNTAVSFNLSPIAKSPLTIAEKIDGGRETQSITFSRDTQLSSRNTGVRVSNLLRSKRNTAGATAFQVMAKIASFVNVIGSLDDCSVFWLYFDLGGVVFCGHCNSVKGKGTMSELKASLKKKG